MPYAADYTLATNAGFQQQVQMSMIKAAVNIASGARTTDNNVDNKRQQLSQQVLNNPGNWIVPFSFAVVEGGGLVTSATDAQIDTAVASVWNGLAGVKSSD